VIFINDRGWFFKLTGFRKKNFIWFLANRHFPFLDKNPALVLPNVKNIDQDGGNDPRPI